MDPSQSSHHSLGEVTSPPNLSFLLQNGDNSCIVSLACPGLREMRFEDQGQQAPPVVVAPIFCTGPGLRGGHCSCAPAQKALRLGPRESAWHIVGAWRLSAPRSGDLSPLQRSGRMGGPGAAGQYPSALVPSSLQLPEDDAAIVGAVRLLSVLIAAVTMDRAGRKVLLFVSGEPHCFLHIVRPHSNSCYVLCRVAGSPRGPGSDLPWWPLPPQGLACTSCSRKACLYERTSQLTHHSV